MLSLLKGLRLSDPVPLLIAVSAGVLWVWLRPASKAPRRYLLAIVLAYWFVSVPLGAHLLLSVVSTGLPRLESRQDARGADAVVLLGGGSETLSVGGLVTGRLKGASQMRAVEAARVFKLIGARLVIASGGVPNGTQQLQPESQTLREALIALGVPASAIVEESKSKTTRDQAVLVGPLLREHDVKGFVLVTSPPHMRRALAAFRAEGLDPVPSEAPLRSEHVRPSPMLLPDSDALILSDQVVYEYAATVYYWWSGWLRPEASRR
jgi:uncharacterized SAM-binding protein YcdF (DUF218 family)